MELQVQRDSGLLRRRPRGRDALRCRRLGSLAQMHVSINSIPSIFSGAGGLCDTTADTPTDVILEQPIPESDTQAEHGQPPRLRTSFPWLLSGADQGALRAQALALLKSLKGTLNQQNSADIAMSLATSRSALRCRASVTVPPGKNGRPNDYVHEALSALSEDEAHRDFFTGRTPITGMNPRLACLFSGQGSRMPTLSDLEDMSTRVPVFAKAFQEACNEINGHLEYPIVHDLEVAGEGSNSLLERNDYSQATLFAFEVAIIRLLESLNVHPDIVTGHSLGEIMAAHAAGALSLREAATIVVLQSQLAMELPNNDNEGMVSIAASEEEVAEELSRLNMDSRATIAAVNSHMSTVVAGTKQAIQILADRFSSSGRRATTLRGVHHAFHSPMMDGILTKLEDSLSSALRADKPSVMAIPLVSTVTGKRADTEQLNDPYHWRAHVRQPVRFTDAMKHVQSVEHITAYVEVGPSSVLSPHVGGCVATHSQMEWTGCLLCWACSGSAVCQLTGIVCSKALARRSWPRVCRCMLSSDESTGWIPIPPGPLG